MIYRLKKDLGCSWDEIMEMTPMQQGFLMAAMEEEQREIRQARRQKSG